MQQTYVEILLNKNEVYVNSRNSIG